MNDVRLLRLKQVLDLIPVGRSTIYEWMAKSTFPQSVVMGGGIVAWRESGVHAWIAERPTTETSHSRPGVSEGVS
ncbi:MAG: hypothetical protein JWO65_1918 [Sphingomonas bacterium]|nr:hypothetical protein [Sphingomonas bacterium]